MVGVFQSLVGPLAIGGHRVLLSCHVFCVFFLGGGYFLGFRGICQSGVLPGLGLMGYCNDSDVLASLCLLLEMSSPHCVSFLNWMAWFLVLCVIL